jgi:hypothetical protein
VVRMFEKDEALLIPALDNWMRFVQNQPEFPNHIMFYSLLLKVHGSETHDDPFSHFLLQRWRNAYSDGQPPVQHIQFVYSNMGPHPLLRSMLLECIVQFLHRPTPDGLNALEQIDVSQLLDTVCVPEHRATLTTHLVHHLESPEIDPLRLHFIATLWGLRSVLNDNGFDIRLCLHALIRQTQAHPRILERLIRITWSQCHHNGGDMPTTVLMPLLEAWSVKPDRSLPLFIMLSWDTALTFVLSAMHSARPVRVDADHDPMIGLLNGDTDSPLHTVNQASFVFAFAVSAPHSIMQRIADRLHIVTDVVALPPRLAAICPLQGVGMDHCVSRLASPYRATLKSAHRMLTREAQVGWWVSWIGYAMLAVRCAEAGGVPVPPLSILPTATIVM